MAGFQTQIIADGEWIDAETVAAAGIGYGLSGLWRRDFDRLLAEKRAMDSSLSKRPGVISDSSAEYSHDPRLHGAHASRAQYVDSRLRSLGIPPLASDEASSLNSSGRIL